MAVDETKPLRIGCGVVLEWDDPRWLSDDNGETGCPACFGDDRQNECWAAQGGVTRMGGDCEAGSGAEGTSTRSRSDAPKEI